MNLREKAWDILCGIYEKNDFSNLSLRAQKQDLSEKDQAFVTSLVYGCLQNDLHLKSFWQPYVKKKADTKLAVLFSQAVYERLYWKKEAYAVLHEYGEIVKKYRKGVYLSFFNAVMRNLEKDGYREAEVTDETEKLSIETSIPLWILRLWNSQYGKEVTEKTARTLCREKRDFVRVNTLKTSKKELEKDPLFLPVEDDACYYEGNIVRSDAFREGRIFVQDLNSQKVSRFAEVSAGEKILDLCAAPGTKTLHMAALMENRGEIVAVDLYENRCELIREAAEKAGASIIHTLCYDATKISEILEKESFDAVCVDAPCSGLGTLRHKPDIKLRLKPEDLDDLAKLQEAILAQASLMVKKGGRLIYSTCTLNRKENERQAENFTNKHPQFRLLEQKTCFPYEKDADGFFMVKWERYE